jgi:uncharacterized paraquat-inducible protein A
VLERTAGRSVDAALALAIATFVLWFSANLSTLLTLHVIGIDRSSRLGSGVIGLFNERLWLVGIVVGLQGIILPFFRFGLLASALAGIKLNRQDLWTGFAFRWAQRLDLWSMPDVFLIGGVIGYSRIAAVLPVTIGPGGWCFIAAAFLTMLTRATLDDRSVWRMIKPPDYTEHGNHIACTECALVLAENMAGRRCPRCAAWLHYRKPYSMMRCTADYRRLPALSRGAVFSNECHHRARSPQRSDHHVRRRSPGSGRIPPPRSHYLLRLYPDPGRQAGGHELVTLDPSPPPRDRLAAQNPCLPIRRGNRPLVQY